MKRIIIKLLIFIIFSLIFVSILSIPRKLDPEELEAYVQHEMDSIREHSENYNLDTSSEKMLEDILRTSYEYSNTFSYRFTINLRTYCIIVVMGIVLGLLGWAHRKELHGR